MKKRYSGPQIVAKLRQADLLIGQGKTVPEVCKELEISQQTYYRWRQKYGGMSPDMVRQLRAVQKENAQLRKLVADQALDICVDTSGQVNVYIEDADGGSTTLQLLKSEFSLAAFHAVAAELMDYCLT